MSDYQEKIVELAELMNEYKLGEAKLQSDGFTIAFRRRAAAQVVSTQSVFHDDSGASSASYEEDEAEPIAQVQAGTPITSPMNGIFYSSPSPSSPAFVKEGETVTAGQVVGLIEAMKVFNEIPSTVSGTVLKMVAESGAMVQPGDVLLYIG